MPQTTPGAPRKNLEPYSDLGRGPLTSYYRRIAEKSAPVDSPPTNFFSRLASFATGNWWQFFRHVLDWAAHRKHKFQKYTTESGTYEAPDDLSLAIAGDWGTGTDEAYEVMQAMDFHKAHYTIHLGDVYYVGDLPELQENCLGEPVGRHKPVKWELGTKGSFALNGNHEMYACGDAYFDHFLPTLGPKIDGTEKTTGQKTSFFCLENKHWRIIGLDTGYNSAGLFFTMLNTLSKIKAIKWFRKVPYFKPSSNLERDLMDWLATVTKKRNDGPQPATILLSHHQYFSGFDDWYRIPGQQLKRFFGDQKVLWYWGHEHRLAVYDHFQIEGGIDAYGRCVGHGGMPVDRGHGPDIHDCKCILWDDRKYRPQGERKSFGYNGFITMRFDGPKLSVDYFDLEMRLLLTEEWETDDNGVLSGPHFSYVYDKLNQHDPAYIEKHS